MAMESVRRFPDVSCRCPMTFLHRLLEGVLQKGGDNRDEGQPQSCVPRAVSACSTVNRGMLLFLPYWTKGLCSVIKSQSACQCSWIQNPFTVVPVSLSRSRGLV